MATDITAKVAVEGEASFKSAMQAINSQIKTLSSEMQASVTTMNGMNSAYTSNAKAAEILGKQLDAQKQKLEILNKQYDNARQVLQQRAQALQNVKNDENASAEAIEKATREYNSQVTACEKLATQINQTEAAINKINAQMRQAGTGAEELSTKFISAGKQLQEVGEKLQSVGSKISDVGTKLTKGLTTPLAGLATVAVKTAADFDTQMSKVSAISGATGESFDKLREKAREVGERTKFSATEAGEAFEYMAMAGWKTGDMLSGIDGIMDLAAASGEDLGTTCDIVTDALTAFGLSASDSGHFADVLAAASSNANTNVSLMGETFKYAAPIAGALGYGIEDVAEAIGLMANAGIKGSQAGTALRKILQSLNGDIKISGENLGDVVIKTTEADGSMRDLGDILAECREAFGQLSESEQVNAATSLVGTNAMSGFLAIMNAAPADIEKLQGALENCDGAAASMAETMQDNLAGQITILKSQLQELAISFGDALMPAIRDAVSKIQGFVDKLNSMTDAQREATIKFGLLLAAIGPVVTVIGKLTSGIGSAVSAVGKMSIKIGEAIASTGSLTGALTSLINPVTLLIAGAAAAAAGVLYLGSKFADAIDPVNGLTDAIKKYEAEQDAASAKELTSARAKADYAEALDQQKRVQQEITELQAQYQSAIDSSAMTEAEAAAKTQEFSDRLESLRGISQDTAEGQRTLSEGLQQLSADISAVTGEAVSFETFAEAEAYMESFSLSTTDAGASAEELSGKMAELQGEFDANQAVIDNYTNSLIECVQNGFLSMADAADALGISEEALEHKIRNTEAAELAKTAATQDATTAADEAIAALEELQTAEEESAKAAEEAAEKYKEYMDELLSSPETISAIAGALGENAQAFMDWAYSAGQSASDVISGIGGMRDAIINDFKEINLESQMSVDEMAAALANNLAVTQQWSSDLVTIWNSTSDSTVRAFIDYLADQGPMYANAVHEFANGGQEKLVEMAYQWQEASELAVWNYAGGVERNKQVATDAATGLAEAVGQTLEGYEFETPGQNSTQKYASGIDTNTQAAEASAEAVANAAADEFADGDFESAGAEASSDVASGIESGSGEITGAMESVAQEGADAFGNADYSGAATSAIESLTAAIESATATIESVFQSAGEAGSNAFKGVDYRSAADDNMNEIQAGVDGAKGNIVSAVQSVGDDAANAYQSVDFTPASQNGMEEIQNAIESAHSNVVSALEDVGNDARDTLENIDYTPAMQNNMDEIIDTINNNQSGTDSAMQTIGDSMADTLQGTVGHAQSAQQTIMDTIIQTIEAQYGTAQQCGVSLVDYLSQGINGNSWSASSAASNVVMSAISQAYGAAAGAYQVGYYISSGMANGIYGGASLVYNAAYAVAARAVAAAKSAAGVASPSKVFRDEVGIMMGKGLAIGLQRSTKMVEDAADKLAVSSYKNIASNAALESGMQAATNYNTAAYTYNTTVPSIQIVQQPGEDSDALAQKVIQYMTRDVRRREAVMA